MTPENKIPASAPASAGESSQDPSLSESSPELADTVTNALQTPDNRLALPGSGDGPAAATWVGRTLGKYRVTSVLGRGGMGVVLKAHDPTIDRDVAIKVLAEHLAADATALGRFLAEARAVGKLNHANVMAIYEICQEWPIHFLVLEYVAGGSVHDRLTDQKSLSMLEATQVLIDVCKGVGAAHAAGLIHRDIKPANFMRTADGSIKVADFGLAKAAASSDRGLTQIGTVIGTPFFMSPEQCQAKPLDYRSDIYSLGATYYTLLTGKKPYSEAETVAQLMFLHCHGPILDPRSVNASVSASCSRIVARAMAKVADERYQSTAEMIGDLQTVSRTMIGQIPVETVGLEPRAAQVPSPPSDPLTPLSSRQRKQAAERRQVTVLVCGCSLFESEAYLEGLDAEDQVKVQRAFYQECVQAMHRLGGTVVQCNEQRLLACFGYPVAYEDAARRAARAGLGLLGDLKPLVEQLRREHKLELKPWVGLHTGPAVVEAAAEVSLAGEARNVAVRLEEVSEPGQVHCTGATHRLIQSHFACTKLGHHKIKGVAQPIDVFRVEGVAETRSPVEAAEPAGLTPLTGRDHEVSLLKDRWEQAQEGMGQVVLLIGEPGLGKSRLVYTLKQHVLMQTGAAASGVASHPSSDSAQAAEDSPVIEWRCSPHFQNSGLYPAADFFERSLGFTRDEAAASRFDRLVRHLEKYDLARPDVVPLFASLLSLPLDNRFPPLGLSPVREREETFRALGDWLRAYSSVRPVLFIVEDLHWVDATVLEFLGQFLAEGLHDRILTVLTFRPEFKTPWPALAHQTSLALNRLTRRQVGDLMRKKTGGTLSEAVVEQVYDRAGGVPLFVEEFTKMVQESSVLDQAGESGTRAKASITREIPATLQDLVMARLDRMEGERELAQLAATLGREFEYELLAAVATVDELTLQAELAKLTQAEIIYQKGRPPRCRYIFKHALLEDALYNALVKEKRQQFHRRIGNVLEAQFPQTVLMQPELLAHHYSEAALNEKAVGYWLKAGLRSRERSADVEAIGHLTRGRALLATVAESPERDVQELKILNALGTAYIASRGYAAPEVGPVFARARDLCQKLGGTSELLAVMWGTWVWHLVLGELRLCMELAQETMTWAEATQDRVLIMEAHHVPAVTMHYRGDFARARDHSAQAIALCDDPEQCRIWSGYTGQNSSVAHRCYLFLSSWQLGDADHALRVSEEAIALARQIAHPFSLAYALHHSNWLYLQARLGAKLRAAAAEQIAITAEQGFAFWHASGTFFKGAGMLLQGELENAMPFLLKGLQAWQATGAELTVTYQFSTLGEAYTQAKRFADARRALDDGLVLAQKNDERCQEAELHRLKGELLLAELPDHAAAAEACFVQAIATARLQRSKAWELRATMSLARLWKRQDRHDEALAALGAAYGKYTEGFTTPDLVDAKALLEKMT